MTFITFFSGEKRRDRHGWLKCTYCQHKLASPDFLVKHIIKDHGQLEHHQCPHCFYRDPSKWAVLIHIQNTHDTNQNSTGFEPQTLECSYLDLKPKTTFQPRLPPYSASLSKGLKCQENECDFQVNHLFYPLKFIFSKKATKIDEIFTVDLTLCSECQIYSEYFVNFCGLLRKHELCM